MLQLRNKSQIKVPGKIGVTSCSSDFIWRFMRLVADGSRVQNSISERPMDNPTDDGQTASIIPPKMNKQQLAPLKSLLDELSNQLLGVCNENFGLMVSRLFQGGSIYSNTYDAVTPDAFIVIYSNQLPPQNMRSWQPRFLLVVYNYICQIAKTTKKLV